MPHRIGGPSQGNTIFPDATGINQYIDTMFSPWYIENIDTMVQGNFMAIHKNTLATHADNPGKSSAHGIVTQQICNVYRIGVDIVDGNNIK